VRYFAASALGRSDGSTQVLEYSGRRTFAQRHLASEPQAAHISPHSLRHAQILARHADPRTTERYDRARGNLDRRGVHFLTAYVAGV
jgi:hypothetical protein